jgi:hypothetical protein
MPLIISCLAATRRVHQVVGLRICGAMLWLSAWTTEGAMADQTAGSVRSYPGEHIRQQFLSFQVILCWRMVVELSRTHARQRTSTAGYGRVCRRSATPMRPTLQGSACASARVCPVLSSSAGQCHAVSTSEGCADLRMRALGRFHAALYESMLHARESFTVRRCC